MPKQPTKTTVPDVPAQDLLSITELALRFDIHRDTVKKKLSQAKIKPVSRESRKILYDLAEVEDILTSTDDEFRGAKINKLETENKIKEIQLKTLTGEYAPVEEFKDILQQIFSNLHKRLAVQLPRKLARKLLHANNETEINEILSSNIQGVFTDLRNDHRKFL